MSSESGAHLSPTEVYLPSSQCSVAFENASDAAIARLSNEEGITFSVLQKVFNHLILNPSFDVKEFTFRSIDDIDKHVSETKMAIMASESQNAGLMNMMNTIRSRRRGFLDPVIVELFVTHIQENRIPVGPDFRLKEGTDDIKLLQKSVPRSSLLDL